MQVSYITINTKEGTLMATDAKVSYDLDRLFVTSDTMETMFFLERVDFIFWKLKPESEYITFTNKPIHRSRRKSI